MHLGCCEGVSRFSFLFKASASVSARSFERSHESYSSGVFFHFPTSLVPGLLDPVSLDAGCRCDLSFRLVFYDWNGVLFFYGHIAFSSDSLRSFTNAAPSVGSGGFCQGELFAESWPDQFKSVFHAF